jgi:hypothetical protein
MLTKQFGSLYLSYDPVLAPVGSSLLPTHKEQRAKGKEQKSFALCSLPLALDCVLDCLQELSEDLNVFVFRLKLLVALERT